MAEKRPALMPGYFLTASARDDIFEIWKFIAADNIGAADALENDIYKTCEFLAENPLIGARKFGLKDARFYTIRKNYMIVYDHLSSPINILRVLHTSRNIPGILK